jgi:hypothetical protein
MAAYQSGPVIGALVCVFQQVAEVGEDNLLARWRILHLGKKISPWLLQYSEIGGRQDRA